MMKRLLLVVIALCCIPLFNSESRACQCAEHGTPVCASFWRSDAVFVGRLVSITSLKIKPDTTYKYVALNFVVEESLRGVSSKRVIVGTSTGNLCDSKFEKGNRYLVYASLDTGANQLFTGGICSPTRRADNAEEVLQELRKLTRRNVTETISGRVVRRLYQGVPGIRIRVEGEGATLETISRKYGDFSFTLPGPGQFKVTAYVPYPTSGSTYSDDVFLTRQVTAELTTFTYDLNLKKNECHYLELDVVHEDPHATATVSGRVLGASGKPVTDGAVQLVNTSETGRDYVELLSKEGSFTFERVAAGEYYLAMNHESPRYDERYPTSYYPNVAALREATKITVKKAASVENLTLQIGPERKGRRVTGVVVWQDGRERQDLGLRIFANGEYGGWMPLKEEDGKFDLVLYGDFEYSIEAFDDGEKIEGKSERITLKEGSSTTGLKLVLRRVRK
jgi:hypothetical protein